MFHHSSKNNRSGAGGLKTHHLWQRRWPADLHVFLVSFPVGRDVPGIPDREKMVVRRVAQEVADLKGGSLLPFYPEWVKGINQSYGETSRHFHHQLKGGVEVPLNLDNLGAVNHGLAQLPQRDIPLRHHDVCPEPGPGGVGSGRGGCVPGRGADDRPAPLFYGLADSYSHPSVLE